MGAIQVVSMDAVQPRIMLAIGRLSQGKEEKDKIQPLRQVDRKYWNETCQGVIAAQSVLCS